MNQHFKPAPRRTPTQAAEGLPRWRWSVAEIERMTAEGLLHEDEKIELIGGEIVPMSPRGRRHEIIRGKVAMHFSRIAPLDVFVIAEPQFNLTDDSYTNPDILVHPAALLTPDVRGEDALLVIEISDSSLGFDLNTKAPLYAAHGVIEYWVINARTLVTTMHRQLQGATYVTRQKKAASRTLTPLLVPALAVALDDFDID